jgi:hypothetical protein
LEQGFFWHIPSVPWNRFCTFGNAVLCAIRFESKAQWRSPCFTDWFAVGRGFLKTFTHDDRWRGWRPRL